MGIGNRLVLLEELEPLPPVTSIINFGIQVLLVIIGLIRDVEDVVHQAGAQRGAALGLPLILVHAHLVVAPLHLSDTSNGLRLQAAKKRFFFHNAVLNIEIPPALILLLPQLAVLDDQVFALVGAPHLVVELLLLVRLALGQVDNAGLSLLLVEGFHDRILLGDEAASALFTGLARPLVHRSLRFVLETGAGKGEGAIFSCFARIHPRKAHGHL